VAAAESSKQTFANRNAGALGNVDKNAFELIESPEGKTLLVFGLALLLQAAESFPTEDLDTPSA
jgi:hypothetical protein